MAKITKTTLRKITKSAEEFDQIQIGVIDDEPVSTRIYTELPLDVLNNAASQLCQLYMTLDPGGEDQMYAPFVIDEMFRIVVVNAFLPDVDLLSFRDSDDNLKLGEVYDIIAKGGLFEKVLNAPKTKESGGYKILESAKNSVGEYYMNSLLHASSLEHKIESAISGFLEKLSNFDPEEVSKSIEESVKEISDKLNLNIENKDSVLNILKESAGD